MAIDESDREDLLGQATQMPERFQVVISKGHRAGIDARDNRLTFKGIELDPQVTDSSHNEYGNEGSPYLEIFVGRRKSGGVSFYFDQNPVFQFNSQGELRRAFVDGRKLAAEDSRLVALERETRGGQISLTRRPMNEAERQTVQGIWQQHLTMFLASIAAANLTIVGQVPQADGLPAWLTTWLAKHASTPLAIAPSANDS